VTDPTAEAGRPGASGTVDAPGPGGIVAVDALRRALPAAQELGLDTAPAERVLAEADERLGLAADAYVVALVGGTGVGKSTLLNALAGQTVSPAGVRRPTTAAPVAWVPAASADRLGPLLARLGGGRPRLHTAVGLEQVVVLDLPDVDSLELAHRTAVETVLPRVDVVAWVTDPEKYADAVLHDGFLRRWLPRLDRQLVVLNKADRLTAPGVARVVQDLEALIAAELPAPAGRGAPAVVMTTAAAGPSGVEPLRRWLAEAAEAKAVVAARLAATARSELGDLAAAAGVVTGYRPLLATADRELALEGAVQEVLRVLDLRGAEARAVGATRVAARRRGTGPAGALTTALLRLAGRGGTADAPAEHLRTWRARGGLAGAGEAIRAAVLTALANLPAPIRGRYALAGATDLEQRLGVAVDRAVARHDEAGVPESRWWPVLGLLQSANQLVLAGVAAWIVIWFVVRPDVADVVLPVAGAVPAPLVLLAAGLLAGYLLARVLSLHAGWLGRRWARALSAAVRGDVAAALDVTAFSAIDRLERARAAIAAAWEQAEAERRVGSVRPGIRERLAARLSGAGRPG
jgi:GTP-binding protein EngB required for normal cell division